MAKKRPYARPQLLCVGMVFTVDQRSYEWVPIEGQWKQAVELGSFDMNLGTRLVQFMKFKNTPGYSLVLLSSSVFAIHHPGNEGLKLVRSWSDSSNRTIGYF